ncbi:MAG: hypothetical protein D8M58_06955 [Calditrichaeota bacterium]|nr:MAG: hypothetical protein DWQ03_19545 [Calditrichota bacterium]MBL1205118.1 hypothetical protein [Calditrichota bacterium]NOG44948.1 hypothetical protein [Calditrichota bacterium]
MKKIEWILRIGIFGTFLGHGIFAYLGKASWLVYLTTVGISAQAAPDILKFIGMLDILVAFIILLRPVKIVIIWALIWTLATALIRPIAGLPIWDFVERAANWAAPLALITLKGWPRNFRDLFKSK